MAYLRILGALLTAVFALGVVGVAVAEASPPEFNPVPTQRAFFFTSGVSTISTASAGRVVACMSDEGTGHITGTDSVANVVMTFKHCTVRTGEGKEECEAESEGGPAGTITTHTLKGNLGTVAAAEAASGVGLLLEPGTGTSLFSLRSLCTSAATVTGKIAGEVSPIKQRQLLSKLKFVKQGSGQQIKKITVLGALVEPTLKFFGEAAALATTEEVRFEQAVEVT